MQFFVLSGKLPLSIKSIWQCACATHIYLHAFSVLCLKGHYVVLKRKIQTQNFNIHKVNEVIMQTQKYLFLFITE